MKDRPKAEYYTTFVHVLRVNYWCSKQNHCMHVMKIIQYLIPWSWLFSRALYFFTSLLSLTISIIAKESVCVILSKYFKVLYFTNLVYTTKLLKYKSLL